MTLDLYGRLAVEASRGAAATKADLVRRCACTTSIALEDSGQNGRLLTI